MKKKCLDGFFNVNRKNGFLPINEPLRFLPDSYKSLQVLIDDLPILKDEKIKGILSFKREVEKRVADLTNFKNEVAREKILLLFKPCSDITLL